VLSITPVTNTVTVGPVEALDVVEVRGERAVWLTGPREVSCQVQLRAHGTPTDASVVVADGTLTARLREPARGIAPGQAVVAYRPDPAGDVVLGSATISSTVSAGVAA
jgi:tRNA-specific 2-thiouridylase